jgi:hypothetical protein
VAVLAVAGCASETHSSHGEDVIVFVDVPGGVAASSTRHGPFHEEMRLASGFSHDTVGAAVAATHLSARLSPTAGPDVATATLIQQCWGDITAARARLADAPPPSDRPPLGDQVPDALYFRIIGGDASGEHVVVSVLADTPQARAHRGFARFDATLRWSGTDWMLRVPTQGAALHPDIDGYTLLGTRR